MRSFVVIGVSVNLATALRDFPRSA